MKEAEINIDNFTDDKSKEYFTFKHKVLLFIMKTLISTCLLLFFTVLSAQEKLQKIDSLKQAVEIDYLRRNFSNNKMITKDFELEILTALSYFLELINTKIKLKKANIKTSLNARPTVLSLIFRKRNNRNYVIRFSSAAKNGSVTFDKASFNAKVGVIGHELCHFIDYQNRDFVGVLARLFQYTNKNSKEKYEKEIDRMTIEHGLGFQLYEWSKFVLFESEASKEYKEFKAEIYLEPHEILDILKEN